MQLRVIGRHFRRSIRKGRRQVELLGAQTEYNLETHLTGRFGRLTPVRRFVAGWLLLIILLIAGVAAQTMGLSGYFQTLQPVPGGIYNEGVLGSFTNANPLYATSEVDTTVSKLLFAGLFTYDSQGKLVSDLAGSYDVNSRGNVYTVHLKPHLIWQDGQPLTSADVAFTYRTIQDPDTQSPLESSWQGIKISTPDAQTVVFTLPDPLASFPDNLTNGIVPKHILAAIPAVDLRSADFNTMHPVGSGPFAWQAIQVSGDTPGTAATQIALVPFAHYQGGQPKLQEFVVHAYADQTQLEQAFESGQLNGAEGLQSLPGGIKNMLSLQMHNMLLRAATMTFFKTSDGVLSDKNVRQALVQGADVPAIIKSLGYPTHAVNEPLLAGQLGYDAADAQAPFNLGAAQNLLTSDGWAAGPDGLRSKAGEPLSFTLTASDTPEYEQVTKKLRQQWRRLGVEVHVQLLGPTDFQTALTSHSYDAILYSIDIGVDPDVFVYWDSSQADVRSPQRLNLSEWDNAAADEALEAGRTRLDPALRVIKYQPFLQAWQQDAPALGLYQPRDLYITNGPLAGLQSSAINTPTDRLDNVQNWEIREAKVTDQ